MQNVTNDQLQKNPKTVQNMEAHEPVLIDGEDKPFVSAYDDFVTMMANFSNDKLIILADDNTQFDASFEK